MAPLQQVSSIVSTLFTEAAQRVREMRRPSDVIDALPVIRAAFASARKLKARPGRFRCFDRKSSEVTELFLALADHRPRHCWTTVYLIEAVDPWTVDSSSWTRFHYYAKTATEKTLPLLVKPLRTELALLLDRWARFFSFKGQIYSLEAQVKGLGTKEPSSPAKSTPQNSDPLDAEDEIILRALADDPARRFTIKRLYTAIKRRVSEKTIAQRLNDLIDSGFAERKKGKNKGAAITEKGKRILAELTPLPAE